MKDNTENLLFIDSDTLEQISAKKIEKEKKIKTLQDKEKAIKMTRYCGVLNPDSF